MLAWFVTGHTITIMNLATEPTANIIQPTRLAIALATRLDCLTAISSRGSNISLRCTEIHPFLYTQGKPKPAELKLPLLGLALLQSHCSHSTRQQYHHPILNCFNAITTPHTHQWVHHNIWCRRKLKGPVTQKLYRAKIVPGDTNFATKIVQPGTILVAKSVPALPKVYQVVRKGR